MLRITRLHVHYTIRADQADRDTIERAHALHVSRCSMAQSVAGAIDVTTTYELA